ncbi:MAG: response regulator transcription factor [Anaerolineales bacterium]|nr:response regulator transcription factor [Anaerolineales bacterium]
MNDRLALIIEDDPDLAFIFAEALKAAGFEIEIIQDGKLALSRLANTNPTVVVLDLQLPHASGEQILRQIRTDSRLMKTRVIIASANSLMAESLRAEADLTLIKPISFSQLRDLAIRLRPSELSD